MPAGRYSLFRGRGKTNPSRAAYSAAVAVGLLLFAATSLQGAPKADDPLKDCSFSRIKGEEINLPGLNGALLVPDEKGKLTSAVAIGDGDPDFDVAEFQSRLITAKWLTWYDRIAWKTSDLVIALIKKEGASGLGAEWFVYRADDKTLAVYGQYDEKNDKYVPKYSFAESAGGIASFPLKATQPPIELARAAHELGERAKRLVKDGLRVNYYVQQGPHGEIYGYILPATVGKNTRIYCKGWELEFSGDGRKVVKDRTELPQKILRFESGKDVEAVIDEDADANPSVGALFFLMRDGHEYKSMMIENKAYRTLLFTPGGLEAAFIRVKYASAAASPRK